MTRRAKDAAIALAYLADVGLIAEDARTMGKRRPAPDPAPSLFGAPTPELGDAPATIPTIPLDLDLHGDPR